MVVGLLCISHIYLELGGSVISLQRYVLAFIGMWLFVVNGKKEMEEMEEDKFFFWVKKANFSNSSGKSKDSYNQTRLS